MTLEQIADLMPEARLEEQRRFFRCEHWTNEELDEFAGILRHMPGGDWMEEHSLLTQRVYAMACVRLKEDDPDTFRRLIERGLAWGGN